MKKSCKVRSTPDHPLRAAQRILAEELFGEFVVLYELAEQFICKCPCMPGGREGRPYGKPIVFATPAHFAAGPNSLQNSGMLTLEAHRALECDRAVRGRADGQNAAGLCKR